MTDAHALSDFAMRGLGSATIQAAVCILLILALQRVLGDRLRPKWRDALWMVVLIRLLVPVSFDASLFAFTRTAEPAPIAPAATTYPPVALDSEPVLVYEPEAVEEFPVITPAASPPITFDAPAPVRLDPIGLLATVWAAGALGLFLFVVTRHTLAMRRLLRDAFPAPDWVAFTLREARQSVGARAWPVVLLSPNTSAPIVAGALRPKVLLPASSVDGVSREDLRLILTHELTHLRRLDLWLSWLWLVALALHWFNPLVWWATARFRRDREEACDELVLAQLDETGRREYGRVLIDALARATSPGPLPSPGAAAIVESKRDLERRLTMIKRFVTSRHRHLLAGLATTSAIATLAFVQIWAYAQEPESEPTPADAASTPDEIQFAEIDDEAELGRIRDEAAQNGDLIRAIEAEMRRVKLRDETGHAYKDKIDLVATYAALPPAKDAGELAQRMKLLKDYADGHPDVDYQWRIWHLRSHIAGEMGNAEQQRSFLEQALGYYPRVHYSDPAKHSKFQHLVNELAMIIWDQDRVSAAEDFVVQTWQKDHRFAYFFDDPWGKRYADFPGSNSLQKLTERMGEKPPLREIRVLLTPDGLLWLRGMDPLDYMAWKDLNWDEAPEGISLPLNTFPFEYFVALGYTSDEITLEQWRQAQSRAIQLVNTAGFDHLSDIGKQSPPLWRVPPEPADLRSAIEQEISQHYSKASPKVQRTIRSTVERYGQSGLWLPEGCLDNLSEEERGKAVAQYAELFENFAEDFNGLTKALPRASVLKDARLVPGLMRIARSGTDISIAMDHKVLAIAALARQEDERAVPMLVSLLGFPYDDVRMWAQAALVRISDRNFGADKQAWADWWNSTGNSPKLGPDDVKPWTPPGVPDSGN